jgi:hypothetical protein
VMRGDFSSGLVGRRRGRRLWRPVWPGDAGAPTRRGQGVGALTLVLALVCAIGLAAGLSGCRSAIGDTADSSSISSPASAKPAAASDSGCVTALNAVSRYGPTVLRNAARASEFVDKAEIDIMVGALDIAATLAHDPEVKQSIRNLADAYLAFKDAWTGATVPPLSAVLADTKDLETLCGH